MALTNWVHQAPSLLLLPQRRNNDSVVSHLVPLTLLLALLLLGVGGGVGGPPPLAAAQPAGGSWQILLDNAGVPAAHMVLTHYDTVVLTDRTDGPPSGIPLPPPCPSPPPADCSAHSAEYTISDNTVRALPGLSSNPLGSAAALTANGTLLQLGGGTTGTSTSAASTAVRVFVPCGDKSCGWADPAAGYPPLQAPRQYASAQLVPVPSNSSTTTPTPTISVVVVGGAGQFSFEFVPPPTQPVYALPFLSDTAGGSAPPPAVESNLYPFLHLLPDATLFVFANQDSVALDLASGAVTRRFRRMPGYETRSFPASGASVLLPLRHDDGFVAAEVMVCGGARQGAAAAAREGRFLPASQNCGRLKVLGGAGDVDPEWVMEAMPAPRTALDMVVLPSGEVVLVNGCRAGTAGWGLGAQPELAPVLYHPDRPLYSRFETLAPSSIPRTFRATAALLPDGRILVGGGGAGPQAPDTRLEALSPPYLDPARDLARPTVTYSSAAATGQAWTYGGTLRLVFITPAPLASFADVGVAMLAPPCVTGGAAMGQRALLLQATMQMGGDLGYQLDVVAPPGPAVAPPGWYLVWVLHLGVPAKRAVWVQLVQ